MPIRFCMSVTAFVPQQETWVQVAQTKYPPMLKMVILRPSAEKVCRSGLGAQDV